MARNITYESCTLVYTLLDDSVIDYPDFSLIVRSSHSYMVEEIKENPTMKNIHVKLGYQASITNAYNKLGTLRNAIGISKLSSHIKECEFSRLEQLRQQFGIAGICDEQPRPTRGRGIKRVFPQRPKPYTKKPQAAPTAFYPEPQEDDTLPDAQPWGVYTHETAQQHSSNYTEDE